MSKIPYPFIPIPRLFFRNGVLDPKKKNFHKRLHFLTLTIGKCYAISHIQDGITYDAFEFSASVGEIAREMDITDDESEALFIWFSKEKFLIKSSHQIKNRPNRYKWDVSLFSDKVIDLTQQQYLEKEKEKNRNQTQSENEEKIGTEHKKSEPKSEPNRNRLRDEYDKKSEPKSEPIPPFLKNDKEAIESSLYKSDNVAKSHAREELPLSFKRQITAFFNPRTYRLRNGEPLSYRMQKALDKYSPREEERLLPNVQFYEEWVDSGKPIKKTHEAFLQHCINEDLARKNEYSLKNDLYAKFLKAENEAHGIEILQKVIHLRKSDHEEPQSISKELPPRTFENILDNYINNYYPRIAHAK